MDFMKTIGVICNPDDFRREVEKITSRQELKYNNDPLSMCMSASSYNAEYINLCVTSNRKIVLLSNELNSLYVCGSNKPYSVSTDKEFLLRTLIKVMGLKVDIKKGQQSMGGVIWSI